MPPKNVLLFLFYNWYCVFLLSQAAAVHLTHVIKGSIAETGGVLNASSTALQRKTVQFLVPVLLPLSRLMCELDLLMATAGQKQCFFMATMNPPKVYSSKTVGLFQFLCSFSQF